MVAEQIAGVAQRIAGAHQFGVDGVGGRRRSTAPALLPRQQQLPTAALDTRLISAVQSRAGGRVHEAANLLQAYYGWNDELTHADAAGDDAAAADAERAFRSAAVQLRRFLYSLSGASLVLA